jgi:hypothetical protein
VSILEQVSFEHALYYAKITRWKNCRNMDSPDIL